MLCWPCIIFVNKLTWRPHFFSPCMFISILYLFRATMCPSSGELTVSMRYLIYVTLVCIPDDHPHRVTYTRYRIDTYLLTPWCRFLLEQLTGLQLVKKFPAFHGTRRFITALTRVRHLSLSWASPIQSIYPHPTCCRPILYTIYCTHKNLQYAAVLCSCKIS